MTLVRFTGNPLIDRFFDTDLFDWTSKNYSKTNTTLPSVNVKENDNEFSIEVAAPGFDKNDFKFTGDGFQRNIQTSVQLVETPFRFVYRNNNRDHIKYYKAANPIYQVVKCAKGMKIFDWLLLHDYFFKPKA